MPYFKNFYTYIEKLRVFIVFLILGLAGCTEKTSYTIVVDSMSAGKIIENKTYFIRPKETNIGTSDLQFIQFSQQMERALSKRGYQRVISLPLAEVLITLGYGIGSPKTNIYSYSVPIFGETGVSSVNTTGYSYGNYYTANTQVVPTYGIVGYDSHVGSYDTYERYLEIIAYDLKNYRLLKQGTLFPLWEVKAKSAGSCSDLRQVFPAMVAALVPYLEQDSGASQSITLFEDDPQISEIRWGSSLTEGERN